MLFRNCAFCAAPLKVLLGAHKSHDCGCQTKYCDALCQRQHWRAGHEKVCAKIERAGGAEKHHATRRCAIAEAMAVRSCVADTAGEMCYICRTDATKEGLVRGCACRGSLGAVHLSCLVRQAVLANEYDPSRTGPIDTGAQWARWHTCPLCEQSYHGVVSCALGWRCWLTYRMNEYPTHNFKNMAMSVLGYGLLSTGRAKEALPVFQTFMADARHYFPSEVRLHEYGQQLIALCYNELGQHTKALRMQRRLFEKQLAMPGHNKVNTIRAAAYLANTLVAVGNYREAKVFADTWALEAAKTRRCEENYFRLVASLANATWKDPDASKDNLSFIGLYLSREYVKSRRVLGPLHPQTRKLRESFTEYALANPQIATWAGAWAGDTSCLLDDLKNDSIDLQQLVRMYQLYRKSHDAAGKDFELEQAEQMLKRYEPLHGHPP